MTITNQQSKLIQVQWDRQLDKNRQLQLEQHPKQQCSEELLVHMLVRVNVNMSIVHLWILCNQSLYYAAGDLCGSGFRVKLGSAKKKTCSKVFTYSADLTQSFKMRGWGWQRNRNIISNRRDGRGGATQRQHGTGRTNNWSQKCCCYFGLSNPIRIKFPRRWWKWIGYLIPASECFTAKLKLCHWECILSLIDLKDEKHTHTYTYMYMYLIIHPFRFSLHSKSIIIHLNK